MRNVPASEGRIVDFLIVGVIALIVAGTLESDRGVTDPNPKRFMGVSVRLAVNGWLVLMGTSVSVTVVGVPMVSATR